MPLIALLLFLLLSVCPGVTSPVFALESKPLVQSSKTYGIDYSKVQVEGVVPKLFLPTQLVYGDRLSGRAPYSAVGGITEIDGMQTGYDISVVSYPGCRGSNSCSIANFSAEKLTSESKSIEDFYSFLREPEALKRYVKVSPDPIGWRTLSNGTRIYFVPWVLGASMGSAQAVWDVGEYRYTISLKGGSEPCLLQMVESAFLSN